MGLNLMLFASLIGMTFARSFSLYGNATLGVYFMKTYVGNPPQLKNLIFDTGSQMTVFPCDGCVHCDKHITKPFNRTASSTYAPINSTKKIFGWNCDKLESKRCLFRQSYFEGSEYSGEFGIDVLRGSVGGVMEDNDSMVDYRHIFGCAADESGLLASQTADGIIGFGSIKYDEHLPPNILDEEFKKSQTKTNTFAFCLSTQGGIVQIGNPNEQYHTTGAQPLTVNCSMADWTSQYRLPITGLRVNSQGWKHADSVELH